MSDGKRRKKGSRAKRGSKENEAPEASASDEAGAENQGSPSKSPESGEESAPPETGSDSADDRGAGDAPSRRSGKKKIKLPAFGMADELLRNLAEQREAEADDETGGDAGETAAEGTTGAAAEEAAAALGTDDPERIYDFADRLQGRQSRGEKEGEEARRQLEPYVTFDLADEIFGLPVEPIREVMRISEITRVPHAPRPIRGVTNLRGRVIPVIDLRQRIGLPPAEIEKTHRIIVVAARQRLIGLLVDGVRQVLHLDVLRIQPPPDDVMTVQSDYISGIYQHERELVLLLDVERSLVVKESESGVA